MKRIIIFLLLLILTIGLSAQNYSVTKAMLLSAVLPGAGELYTGQYTKASIFMGTDIAILLAYLRFDAETKWAVKSYKQFATAKAGAPENAPDEYYQTIQQYYDSDIYNQRVYLIARDYYLNSLYPDYYDPQAYEEYLAENLITEEQSWHWQTDSNWQKYRKLRSDKQDLEIYTKFTYAAAFLNRLISILDSFISTKKINKSIGYLGRLSVYPDWNKKGMEIIYEYNF